VARGAAPVGYGVDRPARRPGREGWVEDELGIQRAAAELQLRAWQHALMARFGPEVDAKLSQHQVEVGMS